MTAKQLRDWEIYYELEPWGFEENELQNAYNRLNTAVSFGAKRKDKKAHKLEDFRLHTKAPKKQSVEEIKHIFQMIADTQNKSGEKRQHPPAWKRRYKQ